MKQSNIYDLLLPIIREHRRGNPNTERHQDSQDGPSSHIAPLPAAHTETERRSCIRNRHPEKEPDRRRRCRSCVINRCWIIVPLHNNRAIMTLNVDRSGRSIVVVVMMMYWSGRRIAVMMMNLVLVVPIAMITMMPTIIVVCQRNTSAQENQKSCN